ncbi:diaminopimelate decarboxylase (plasmid) [Rhizobium sp. NIBRBAC000502774]|nr:diaminopimelate decarboxylase [Rhizobium sp. NIBRBAC000502774]
MIGNERLWHLVDTVGTPLYLFDATIIRKQCHELRTSFETVDFFYSLKANPNLSIVREVVSSGFGCEVCSMLEFETALIAGVQPDKVLFVGPAKSHAELSRCISVGIKAIVIESLAELDCVQEIASALGKTQNVALRVNPDFLNRGAKLNMSGRATQFGIDQPAIEHVIKCAEAHRNIRIVGIHAYMGTRILDAVAIVENARHILSLADEIQAGLEDPLHFVDVGGGFGVPYHEGETSLDLTSLRHNLSPVLRDYEERNPAAKVCIELGRYIVAEAGQFITAVRQTKTTKGENFAICDGGSNVHSAAAGQGSLLRKNFPITLRKRGDSASPQENWTVTGPLCTPMDIIGKDVLLSRPEVGDLICVHRSGAYGASASPVNFLGFGHPAEVMLDADIATLVRRPASLETLLEEQRTEVIDFHASASVVSQLTDENSVFDHPCLRQLDELESLLVDTGRRLEDDPEAWRDLWDDPVMRAFTLIGVPDRYNGFPLKETGLGLDTCSYSLHIAMIERLARFDSSSILALQGPSLSGGAVLKMGTDAQIDRFFSNYRLGPQGTFFAVTEPAGGSDPMVGSSAVTRVNGQLRLSGCKMLVGNIQRSAVGLFFARSAETDRPVLLMIDSREHAAHLKIERLPTFGLRGADLCRLSVSEMPVDEAMIVGGGSSSLRDGFLAINDVFERNRPIVAALALGAGLGIVEHMGRMSSTADRAVRDLRLTHAALLRRLGCVLATYENGRPRMQEISLIKLQAVAFADQVIERAFALPGSAALMMEPTLRKRIRDAKAFEYMEGATNIHAMNAFRSYVAGMPR